MAEFVKCQNILAIVWTIYYCESSLHRADEFLPSKINLPHQVFNELLEGRWCTSTYFTLSEGQGCMYHQHCDPSPHVTTGLKCSNEYVDTVGNAFNFLFSGSKCTGHCIRKQITQHFTPYISQCFIYMLKMKSNQSKGCNTFSHQLSLQLTYNSYDLVYGVLSQQS